jgi:hypothetical protein
MLVNETPPESFKSVSRGRYQWKQALKRYKKIIRRIHIWALAITFQAVPKDGIGFYICLYTTENFSTHGAISSFISG